MKLRFLLALIFVPGLFADTYLFNTRPTDVAVSTDVNTGQPAGPQLQNIVNRVFCNDPNSFCAAAPDVQTEQSRAAMWTTYPDQNHSDPYSITPKLQVEFAGWQNSNTFGIWSVDPANVIHGADVFSGTDSAPTTALLTWLNNGSLTIAVGGAVQTVQGIDPLAFGFYLRNQHNETWYSSDKANGGAIKAVAYQGKVVPDSWVIGFEDTGTNADNDFNDMVVSIDGLAPVPEPGSIILLGSSLLGLTALLRRRMVG